MITNKEWISQYITNNKKETIGADGTVVTAYEPVPYRWTHGATDNHLGDGLLLYSIVQLMRYKTIICLGSGGGFVPRILTQET